MSTITASQSLSNEYAFGLAPNYNARRGHIQALHIPTGWTGTQLSFQVKVSNGTFARLMRDDGTEYTITVAENTVVVLPAQDFWAFESFKFQSGTSAAPVVQASTVTISVFAIPDQN